MNHHTEEDKKDNILYGVFTDQKGNYALKLDGELLVRTNDSVDDFNYNVEVAQFKVPELTNKKDQLKELKDHIPE